MLNEKLIQTLINVKLDEILNGNTPDGFIERSRDDKNIHLVAENAELFGMRCQSLHVSFEYRNVLITISHV